MDDTRNDDKANRHTHNQIAEPEAARWVPHSLILDVLFNAIQEDGSASAADDLEFEEIDDFFDGDEMVDLDDDEEKNSTLRLLSKMKPRLAELLTKA